MKKKRRILAVLLCLFFCTIAVTIPAYAADKDTEIEKNILAMDEFAFQVYKTIRSIVVPLAIISFASCAYKFLGSIFFGNYASMAGNDMMKAQRQLIYTVMAVLFIVLLPTLLSEAIELFEDGAWEPPETTTKS